MNYGGIWSGSVENQLIDINKMMQIRTLTKAKIVGDKDKEYILGVDVARSMDTSNNQSSVSVLELRRNAQKRITNINLVNMFNVSNALNFTGQAIEIKKIQKAFNAKAVIVDTNGLGK
jgi:ribonucleoside-diphosphate reductase alpha chain